MEEILTFEGCNYFRQRLVLATLSSKAVRITKLRKDEDNPGLRGEKEMLVLSYNYCEPVVSTYLWPDIVS